MAMVWEGKDVIKYGRTMIGATNPLASAPGTIRGDYGIETGETNIVACCFVCLLHVSQQLDDICVTLATTGRNIIHGSDSVEVTDAFILFVVLT